jgi:hypothetical protein
MALASTAGRPLSGRWTGRPAGGCGHRWIEDLQSDGGNWQRASSSEYSTKTSREIVQQ